MNWHHSQNQLKLGASIGTALQGRAPTCFRSCCVICWLPFVCCVHLKWWLLFIFKGSNSSVSKFPSLDPALLRLRKHYRQLTEIYGEHQKSAESESPYLTQTAYISAILNEAPENCRSSYSILKTYFFTKCYFASVHAAFYFRHLKLQNIPMISLSQA